MCGSRAVPAHPLTWALTGQDPAEYWGGRRGGASNSPASPSKPCPSRSLCGEPCSPTLTRALGSGRPWAPPGLPLPRTARPPAQGSEQRPQGAPPGLPFALRWPSAHARRTVGSSVSFSFSSRFWWERWDFLYYSLLTGAEVGTHISNFHFSAVTCKDITNYFWRARHFPLPCLCRLTWYIHQSFSATSFATLRP